MDINIKISSLTDKQRSIFKDIVDSNAKYFSIKAGRQSGKSHLLERIAFYYCTKQSNKIMAFIMPTERQLLKMFKSMVNWIPKSVISFANKSSGNKEIKFINGTSLMFYTANAPDTIAGQSFDAIFADEFGLFPQGSWSIISPTVSAKKNAKVVFVSTPRGKNDFHTIHSMGLSDEYKRYKSYQMSFSDNPYYDLEDVKEAKRSMPDVLFRQEYLAEFIFGLSSVFGSFGINQTVEDWEGRVNGEEYFFGIDWSGTGEDKTVLTIINSKGKIVKMYECRSNRMPEQAAELEPIIKSYNAVGYGESNGLGASGCELLQDKGIRLIKFVATNESKQKLVSSTIEDLNNKKLFLPTPLLCNKLDNEMSMYIVKRTMTGKLQYTHPDSGHDDYVDSMMMANMARRDNNSGLVVVTENDLYDYEETIYDRMYD